MICDQLQLSLKSIVMVVQFLKQKYKIFEETNNINRSRHNVDLKKQLLKNSRGQYFDKG